MAHAAGDRHCEADGDCDGRSFQPHGRSAPPAGEVDLVVDALFGIGSVFPPELVADIMDQGIVLAGGGALAAELALPHRIKRTPFQQAEMTTEQLQERIEQLAGQSVPSDADQESEPQQGQPEEKKT